MGPPGAGGSWRPSNAKFILAGERLFGVSVLSGSVSVGGVSQSGSVTMVNLLASNPGVDIAGFRGVNPYTMPMLTFHGVVAGGLTIGGGVGYTSTTGSHEEITPTGGTITIDAPTRTAIAVAPRIGYLASFSPTFGIWAKGGITYHTQTTEYPDDGSEESINGVAVSIDPMLVFTPLPHVGIVFGPTLDLGVSGTIAETGIVDRDITLSNFGAAAGIALLF